MRKTSAFLSFLLTCNLFLFPQSTEVRELLNSYRYNEVIERLSHEPETEENLMIMASCLEHLNKTTEALTIYENIIKNNSSNLNAVISAAECSASMGETEQALKHWITADSLSQNNLFIKVKKTAAFHRNSNWNETIESSKEVFLTDSLSHLLRITGDAFLQINEADSAIWYYLKAIEKNPANALTVQKLTNLYYSAKFYESAIELTDNYLKNINNRNKPIGQLNGMANYSAGNYKEAIERLNKNTSEGDSTYSTLYFLGMSHYALKEYPRAVYYLDKVYQINDTDINLLFYYGNALSFTSEKEKSIEVLQQGVDKIEDINEILYDFDYSLARNYVNSRSYQKGIKHYKSAYQRNSEKSIILYNIADAYDSLQDYKNAIEYFRRFLKTAPEGVDYDGNIDEIIKKGSADDEIFYIFSHKRIEYLEKEQFFESGKANNK